MFYLTGGATMQFVFQFVMPSVCMIATGANPNYTISNLHLVQSMNQPSEQAVANIMKSSLLYRFRKGYHAVAPVESTQVMLNSSIPQGCRAKKILVSFHPRENYSSVANPMLACDGSSENLISGPMNAKASLHYPLGFMPQLSI